MVISLAPWPNHDHDIPHIYYTQADRSQHRNKATALAVLRAKLRQRRAEAVQAERAVLRQGLGDNAWGNQIRWVMGREGSEGSLCVGRVCWLTRVSIT